MARSDEPEAPHGDELAARPYASNHSDSTVICEPTWRFDRHQHEDGSKAISVVFPDMDETSEHASHNDSTSVYEATTSPREQLPAVDAGEDTDISSVLTFDDDDSRFRSFEELLSPPPGTGQFLVGDELGRGGQGKILRTTDRDLRRQVAMKVLLPQHRDNLQSIVRFLQEAQITGQLEHPNIVPVHRLGTDRKGRLYFTMKLVKGETLSRVLSMLSEGRNEYRLRYHMGELLQILLKVCDAVAFAHARGVMHRDLKPSNIMIGHFGEVLVMACGLARITKLTDVSGDLLIDADHIQRDLTTTQQGHVVGTPSYMPPEQAAGAVQEVDQRSDVYALGAILYEMLTLRPPVIGHNLQDLLCKAREGRIDPLPRHAPERLQEIVTKALSLSQEDRQQSVSEFAQEIKDYLDKRNDTSRTEQPTDSAIKRQPWLLAALSLAIVATCVSTGMWLNERFDPSGGEARPQAPKTTINDARANARSMQPWLLMADYYSEHGDLVAAEEAFWQATQIDSGAPLSWERWGQTLLEHGRAEEAMEKFNRAIAAEPTRASAWRLSAQALQHLGRFREAHEDLSNAAELQPRNAVIQAQWADCLVAWRAAIDQMPPERQTGELETLADAERHRSQLLGSQKKPDAASEGMAPQR